MIRWNHGGRPEDGEPGKVKPGRVGPRVGRNLIARANEIPIDDVKGTGAASIYKMWHARDANEAGLIKRNIGDKLGVIGTAVSILYVSDKWEKEGDGFKYIHDFESRPTVYGTKAKERTHDFYDLVPCDTAAVDGVSEKVPIFPVLGVVVYIEVQVGDRTYRYDYSPKPALGCSSDKRAVVIVDPVDFIVIRGGSMRVTDRGIVA